ncbi:MAG: type II toxin-antitoxin system Phd/YefM family antitoxin [Opitutales bacterium]
MELAPAEFFTDFTKMKIAVEEAEDRLAELVDKAVAGEEVSITKGGSEVATLVAKGKPLQLDPHLLEILAKSPLEAPSEQTVRDERDSRD